MDETTPFARWIGPHGLAHQPGLDGLRGLAVAAVVAFHLGIDQVGGGFLGVSLFFTLSGLLIGTLILDEVVSTGRFSLPAFCRRRARRLLPPALVTLAVIAVGRVLIPALHATTRGDVVAAGLNVANWHLLAEGSSYADLFGGPSAVLHFWSLAIEEQFYLAVGLVAVLVAGRARRPVRLVFVIAVSTATLSFFLPIVAGAEIDRMYYGSDTRAGELMVGVAAAAVLMSGRRRALMLARSRWLVIAAVGAMAVTAALWVVATPGGEALRRGLLPLTSACSLLLIVGALLPGGPVAALARSRPLRWLGGISYAVYLVHWPVIVMANRLTIDRSTGRSVALVAISLALAQLTVVVVEHPIRRRRIVGRPLAVAATATLAIVAVSAVVDGRATRSAALLGGLAAEAAGGDAEEARAGDSAARVAIFGDSVGLSLLLALGDTAVTPEFQRAPSEVDLGCGIALSPSPPPDQPGACDDPAARFAAKAAAHGADAAILVSCQWELLAQPLPGAGDERYVLGDLAFDDYVRARYEDVADRLAGAGVDRVLWMSCPYLSATVGLDGLSPWFVDSRDPARVDRLNTIIASVAAARPDVEVLAFSDWVNQRIDDAAIRPDGSHFEYRGHNPAADAFVEYVNAALAR